MKKKSGQGYSFWTSHSPLYYAVLILWLVMFAAGFIFLSSVPKASPIVYAYLALMTLICLFGLFIQYWERRGLPTLPGWDFRRNVKNGD